MNIPEGLSQEQVDEAIRITDASEKAYGPVFATLISLLLPSLSLGTPAYCLPEDEYEEIFGPALGAEGVPDGPVYYAVDGDGLKPVTAGEALIAVFPVNAGFLLTALGEALVAKLAPFVPDYAARVMGDVQDARMKMLNKWRYLLSRKPESLRFGYYSVNESGVITMNDEGYPAFSLSLRELMQNVSGEYGDYVFVSGGQAYTPSEAARNEAKLLSQAQLAPSKNALLGILQTRAAYEASVKGL